MTDLRKIIIDGKELEVDPAMTLLQACEEAGIEIPFPYRTVEFFDKTDYNALLSGIDAENIVALPRRPAALTRPQEEAAGE